MTKWEKSPLLAGILSLLLPGGGQYYNGQVGKALLVEGAIGGGILMILSSYQETKIYHESDGYCFFGGCQWDTIRTRDEGLQIAGGILAGAAWVYSIVDAPVQSMEMNRRRAERLDLRVTGPGSSRLPGGGWVAGAEMTYHF